jgi:hypothetical protein
LNAPTILAAGVVEVVELAHQRHKLFVEEAV